MGFATSAGSGASSNRSAESCIKQEGRFVCRERLQTTRRGDRHGRQRHLRGGGRGIGQDGRAGGAVRPARDAEPGRDAPPEQRAGVEEILVITFTEKATKEMKTRIVEELTRLGLTEERRQVETAYISTIHGFCSRLLQENPFEVGIDPHFTVLEEPQARRLLRQTVETVVAHALRGGRSRRSPSWSPPFRGCGSTARSRRTRLRAWRKSVESLLAKLRSAGTPAEEIERHWQSGLAATAAARKRSSGRC